MTRRAALPALELGLMAGPAAADGKALIGIGMGHQQVIEGIVRLGAVCLDVFQQRER